MTVKSIVASFRVWLFILFSLFLSLPDYILLRSTLPLTPSFPQPLYAPTQPLPDACPVMRAGRRAYWWNNEEAILLHQRTEVQKGAKKPKRFLTVNVRFYIWQITFRNEQEENKSKWTVCLFSQVICLQGFCPIYTSGPPQALSDSMSVALRDWSRVCQCQWRPPWQQITLTGFLLLPLIAPQPGTVQTPWVGRVWGVCVLQRVRWTSYFKAIYMFE